MLLRLSPGYDGRLESLTVRGLPLGHGQNPVGRARQRLFVASQDFRRRQRTRKSALRLDDLCGYHLD